MIRTLSLLAIFLFPTGPAKAFWWVKSELDEAREAQDWSVDLDTYARASREDRRSYVAEFVSRSAVPEEDVDLFLNCANEYAATKNPDLPFSEIASWCEREALTLRGKFEDHFNELDARDLSVEALTLCQAAVRDRLRAPNTASFPWTHQARSRGRWSYSVASYVDAQNGFGAEVRTRYFCDVRYVGSTPDDAMHPLDWEWDRLDLVAR